MKKVFLICACGLLSLSVFASDPPVVPKNVIIMIGDGMGFNQTEAASLYRFGHTKGQIYWTFIPLAARTYSLNNTSGYDPSVMYRDFNNLKKTPTDSAAAATALSTGTKTKNAILGLTPDGKPLRHIMEDAEALGKSTGVLSTVYFSHATPAGFIVHEPSRDQYDVIANEMLWKSAADVIIAAGHPWYDDDGKKVGGFEPDRFKTSVSYTRVGGLESWKKILNGEPGADADGDGTPDAWTLVDSRQGIRSLASGSTPKRVLGLVPIYSTLQQDRSGNSYEAPYVETQLPTSPTMTELMAAALHCLSKDDDGFVLMAEGGAIDWASHANQSGRVIEETIDFDRAIEFACEWIEENSNWDETLLVITADHETGYMTGPGSDPTWQPLINHGLGKLPGMEWHSSDHTNRLVPLFVKGAGANSYNQKIRAIDPLIGPYIDNTDIVNTIRELWKIAK